MNYNQTLRAQSYLGLKKRILIPTIFFLAVVAALWVVGTIGIDIGAVELDFGDLKTTIPLAVFISFIMVGAQLVVITIVNAIFVFAQDFTLLSSYGATRKNFFASYLTVTHIILLIAVGVLLAVWAVLRTIYPTLSTVFEGLNPLITLLAVFVLLSMVSAVFEFLGAGFIRFGNVFIFVGAIALGVVIPLLISGRFPYTVWDLSIQSIPINLGIRLVLSGLIYAILRRTDIRKL